MRDNWHKRTGDPSRKGHVHSPELVAKVVDYSQRFSNMLPFEMFLDDERVTEASSKWETFVDRFSSSLMYYSRENHLKRVAYNHLKIPVYQKRNCNPMEDVPKTKNKVEPLDKVKRELMSQNVEMRGDRWKSLVADCKQYVKQHLLDKLIGAEDGVPLQVTCPASNPAKLGPERPAALRVYYSTTDNTDSHELCLRYAYGTGSGSSTVGIDPRDFEVRDMPACFSELGIIAREMLLEQGYDESMCQTFNFVEVKIYMGSDIMQGFSCKLGLHTDMAEVGTNTQKEGSLVLTLSLGEERELIYDLQIKPSKLDGTIPRCKPRSCGVKVKMPLRDSNVNILHPDDELWKLDDTYACATRYRHGVLRPLKEGISVAVVFRSATEESKMLFEQETNLLYLQQKHLDHLNSPVMKRKEIKTWGTMQEHYDQCAERKNQWLQNHAPAVHSKISEYLKESQLWS